MDNTTVEHNNNVSEEHQKYLIEVVFNEKTYYTINGTDLETEDEDDKVLVDDQNKLLLFSTIDKVFDFLKTSQNLFDKENFQQWADNINQPITPYNTVDFDVLSNDVLDIDTYEKFDLVITSANLASDYYYQSGNDSIIDLFSEAPLSTLLDIYMNIYIWEEGEKLNLQKLKEDAVPKLQQVFNALKSDIDLV